MQRSDILNLATIESVGQTKFEPVDSIDSDKWISRIRQPECMSVRRQVRRPLLCSQNATLQHQWFALGIRIDERLDEIHPEMLDTVHTVDPQFLGLRHRQTVPC
jgi:hypothetical protein